MGLFKALGGGFQSINSIVEGARKKRDAKKFIAEATARQRNWEQIDLVNNAAMINVSGEANRRALEEINLKGAQGFEQAADAGVRGIGMIGKIQQNINIATGVETDKLSEKQFGVDVMAAREQSNIQNIQFQDKIRQQTRTDQMLERGQALRSQGSAEVGAAVSQFGGAIGQTIPGVAAFSDALSQPLTEGGIGGADSRNIFKAFLAGSQSGNIQPQGERQLSASEIAVNNSSKLPSLATPPYFNQFTQIRNQFR